MGINQTIWKNQQRIPCNVSIHWKSVAVKQAVLSALKCIIRFAELVLKGRGKSFFSLHLTDTGLTVYCIPTQEGVQEALLHFLVYGFHDNMHVYVLCFLSSTALIYLT